MQVSILALSQVPHTMKIEHTVICSLAILLVVLLISAFLQDHIQIVLDFTGGIFGMGTLFFIPVLEVWRARKIIHRQGEPRNYIVWLPIVVAIFSSLLLCLNLYHIINKIVHPSNQYYPQLF
jgi:putative effector of murein hydrolase LrgA (UPF0299 family)